LLADLQFSPIMARFPELLTGLWLTIELSAAAIVCGSLLGLCLAATRYIAPSWSHMSITAYVELIRNTPFLIQLYIIFFGLPAYGIKVTALQAGLLAMSINLGAYSTEIFRAGIDAIPRGQIEAGIALSLRRWQVFRHIILKPALEKIYPALVSQYVLVMLMSSVCSFISVEELSGAASTIQSATFRSFESYLLVAALYLALTVVLKSGLSAFGIIVFGKKERQDKKSVARHGAAGLS